MLEWTELEYCYLQYEQGLVFLEKYLNGDAYAISLLERTAEFWGWWKSQWLQRDEEFMYWYQDMLRVGVELRQASYTGHNKGAVLASKHCNAAERIDESFAVMMRTLQKPRKREVRHA